MREIKFRAWHKKNKKMYIVNGFSYLFTNWETKTYSLELWEIGMKDGRWGKGKIVAQGNEVELMQFTGLKDKNGKEIYEGDIIIAKYDLEARRHRNIKVQWESSRYRNGWNVGGNGKLFEVIGNIYENPELLALSPERKQTEVGK